jgi:hypothetical protein
MSIVIAGDPEGIALERVVPVADLPGLPGDFADFGRWLKATPGAMMRELPAFQLPVPRGLDYEQKQAWLFRVAASWGTGTFTDDMGGERAEMRFGGVRIVASIGHRDTTYSGYAARAAARRSSVAGNGATS